MSKHYKNETGTDLILDVGVSLSTTPTVVCINYESPSGVIGTFYGAVYSSYSLLAAAIGTYFVKHTLAYTDLNESGEWEFQAYVGAVDGTWWGENVKEIIYDRFE